jgi:hypothetical protein
MAASAMLPPLRTSAGLTPKKAGFHTTRSAHLPTSSEPIDVRDAVRNGGVDGVFGDVALDAEVVVAAAVFGQRASRWLFILSAVCQVRMMTSPTRPMAWLSLLMMLMAPMSCRMSSAAMVSRRMRLSAKARSSGMDASRWWHTMSMSTCSSSVLTV